MQMNEALSIVSSVLTIVSLVILLWFYLSTEKKLRRQIRNINFLMEVMDSMENDGIDVRSYYEAVRRKRNGGNDNA